MNNFFINFTVRSFTNIERIMQVNNTQDSRRLQRFNQEVQKKKEEWEIETHGAFKDQLTGYEHFVTGDIKKQVTGKHSSGSLEEGATKSTNSGEKPRVLVTGVNGFLGSQVCMKFLENGDFRVRGTMRSIAPEK